MKYDGSFDSVLVLFASFNMSKYPHLLYLGKLTALSTNFLKIALTKTTSLARSFSDLCSYKVFYIYKLFYSTLIKILELSSPNSIT